MIGEGCEHCRVGFSRIGSGALQIVVYSEIGAKRFSLGLRNRWLTDDR